MFERFLSVETLELRLQKSIAKLAKIEVRSAVLRLEVTALKGLLRLEKEKENNE